MKRKLVFLGILFGITLLVFFLLKFFQSRTPKEGELRVDSAPVGSVFIDNKHVGRTPYKDKLTTGEYTIKIMPDSTVDEVASWQGKVTVGPNLLTYVNANLSSSDFATAVDVLWLEKLSGKDPIVSVTTNPDGATVVIDDATKGTTPLEIKDIKSGDHTLTVTTPGFAPRTLKIKATPGYKLVASMKLSLVGGGTTEPETSPTTTPEPTTTAETTPTPSVKTTATPTPTVQAADPPKPYALIKDTPTGYLRVRLEPSTSSSEAARVKPGEKYSILDEKSSWYQIKYDGTNKGWISGQYAEKVE